MLIPEDGSLPQITRKGFAAFNNVMLIKVPEKLKKPNQTNFQLATLDRTKKGERWPADQYVDIIMNNTSNSTSVRKNTKEIRKKFVKKFSDISVDNQNQAINSLTAPIVSPNNASFNPHFTPNAYPDHQVPHIRFDDNYIQCNERTFNDDPHTYRYPNNFSNDQLYGGRDNLLGEGSSSNLPPNRFENFDFLRNPPPFPNTYVSNPYHNSNRLEPNFINSNNFERPPYHCDPGLNDGANIFPPPLLPLPPHLTCDESQFQHNYNGSSQNWKNRNQRRRDGNAYKPWRGRRASNNKFPKGNNRRANNRYSRKNPT